MSSFFSGGKLFSKNSQQKSSSSQVSSSASSAKSSGSCTSASNTVTTSSTVKSSTSTKSCVVKSSSGSVTTKTTSTSSTGKSGGSKVTGAATAAAERKSGLTGPSSSGTVLGSGSAVNTALDDKAEHDEGTGRLKISLQTIHQHEELKQESEGAAQIAQAQTRIYKRSASETSVPSQTQHTVTMQSSSIHQNDTIHHDQKFSLQQSVAHSSEIMLGQIKIFKTGTMDEQYVALRQCFKLIVQAWMVPQYGRDYASALCDVLRNAGALEILVENCWSSNRDIKLESARLLEQSLTTENRDRIVKVGLEQVVKMSCVVKDDTELARASTGIIENLFKHSENTCARVIALGGLNSLLYSCRSRDKMTLRHCAVALANLAIYGGPENQHEMIKHNASEWLFPLAFSRDDSIRYYACLAIIILSANKEIEVAVVNSGTLGLVQPFIMSHTPADFAHSDSQHLHGRAKGWLQRLVTVLESKREEAQSLAAFHFAMEAEIKKEQGKLHIFKDIGAIEPLKRVASSPNALASKFASQALSIIGEEVPYKLSQQVPLWSEEDVQYWLGRVGFSEYEDSFVRCRVDGDLLLMLTDESLRDDVGMENGLIRKRFMKEVKKLKMTSDYRSCDPTKIDHWLLELGSEFSQYTYQMLASGIDKQILPYIHDDNLKNDCSIVNGIHRMKIIYAIKNLRTSYSGTPTGVSEVDGPQAKPIDVFISYRRSNGSQLASLLKVHLQLRGFTVFLDIERLTAGKFDESLLNSVRNARNFLLVLTPNSLDRCLGDDNQKDWVHKEILSALDSGCNIVPVMDKFEWPSPDSLPEDIRSVSRFNGIKWIHDYQDACVDKLERFLRGESLGVDEKALRAFSPPNTLSCEPPMQKSLSKGSSFNSTCDNTQCRWSSDDLDHESETGHSRETSPDEGASSV
ncbi:NAD(+) hydrolase SARM1-like isoform X2 [Tubulanus polymorphus]|uniref:NAD(+) hydrolase SARM1-like isoform X2 n=1 Tax=Tubulanus polymorphus TaxID=672921 RepID=UPI003DA2CE14